jgi:hypothetical protein
MLVQTPMPLVSESFLLLFSKKEVLSSLSRFLRAPPREVTAVAREQTAVSF